MVHPDWDRVRMELTGVPQCRPPAKTSAVAEEGAVTPPDAYRSPTVPDLDNTNIGHTDELLEHIALALADRADQSS